MHRLAVRGQFAVDRRTAIGAGAQRRAADAGAVDGEMDARLDEPAAQPVVFDFVQAQRAAADAPTPPQPAVAIGNIADRSDRPVI